MLVFALAAIVCTALPGRADPSPQTVLLLIRNKFRSHRPPPPFITYSIERYQKTEDGYTDYAESYTYHVWCRNLDRAALARRYYALTGADGPLEFQRPAFNEPRDPGPPTADLFEPAPAVPHTIDFVPTPEAAQTPLPIIGQVIVVSSYDYRVDTMDVDDDLLHLTLSPLRDPDRNRLRELWVNRSTYELRKVVATDKLFIDHGATYPVTFTIYLTMQDGRPVVSDIHGLVGGGYSGDGEIVDYHFRNIAFPASLPDWYFDPHTYAAHVQDAPK